MAFQHQCHEPESCHENCFSVDHLLRLPGGCCVYPETMGLFRYSLLLPWYRDVPFISFSEEKMACGHSISVRSIVAMALLLRAPFLFSEPVLSDDIYRYVFDGLVQIAGGNPYAVSPIEYATSSPIMSELVLKVNHGDLVTIYPPFSQLFFFTCARFGLIGIKGGLILLDLLTIVLLLKLLHGRGWPLHPVVLYAWNPLVVWEISWSGHVDILGLVFTIALIWAVQRQSTRWLAGCFYAMAVWTKLVPLIFFPFILLTFQDDVKRGGFISGDICWSKCGACMHLYARFFECGKNACAIWEELGVFQSLLSVIARCHRVERWGPCNFSLFVLLPGAVFFSCSSIKNGWPLRRLSGGVLFSGC